MKRTAVQCHAVWRKLKANKASRLHNPIYLPTVKFSKQYEIDWSV